MDTQHNQQAQPNQQGQHNQQAQRGQQQSVDNLAEVFVQGSARLLDLQASAVRALMQTQSRTAAMLGGPDWSPLFNNGNGDQLSNLFSTGAEQAVQYLRQTSGTIREVQNQFAELVEQQTQQITQQMRKTLEELGRQGQQGMEEIRRTSQHAMGEAQRTAREMQQSQQGQGLHGQGSEERSPIITAPGEQSAEERGRSKRSA